MRNAKSLTVGAGLFGVNARTSIGAASDEPPSLVTFLTMTVLLLGDVKSRFSEIVSRVHDHHER